MKVNYRDRMPAKHTDEYSIYFNDRMIANGTGGEWAASIWTKTIALLEQIGRGSAELLSYDEDGDAVSLENLSLN